MDEHCNPPLEWEFAAELDHYKYETGRLRKFVRGFVREWEATWVDPDEVNHEWSELYSAAKELVNGRGTPVPKAIAERDAEIERLKGKLSRIQEAWGAYAGYLKNKYPSGGLEGWRFICPHHQAIDQELNPTSTTVGDR